MTSHKVIAIIVLSVAVVIVYGLNFSNTFPYYREAEHVEASVEPNHVEATISSYSSPVEQTDDIFENEVKAETQVNTTHEEEENTAVENAVRRVPFYSQFGDIKDPTWQKVGCGIASIAMLIEYYVEPVSVDDLLYKGLDAGYFLDDAGWTHAGLIDLTRSYGLDGESINLTDLTMENAFEALQTRVAEGPVMASVYYTFTPGHPIPHLVVINDIRDGLVYYSDPADASGNRSMPIEKFKPAWKQRYIEIHPS